VEQKLLDFANLRVELEVEAVDALADAGESPSPIRDSVIFIAAA
jgi:hypothetical protein